MANAAQLSPGTVRDRLTGFSFGQQVGEAQRLAGVLERAGKRFRRGRLQIGLLGRAGQGKSTLLRRLTGLGEDVIPSGKRGHCTGARCILVHTGQDKQAYARLHFADERTFLANTVRPYFDFFQELFQAPESLDDFAAMSLRTPEAGADFPSRRRSPRRSSAHLSPPPLAGRAATFSTTSTGWAVRDISGSEIRRPRVAQDDPSGKRLSQYQAVEFAEIFCRFPRERSRVSWLSWTCPAWRTRAWARKGNSIRLMAEDVDAALLVRLPQDNRDCWMDFDMDLYRVARQALGALLPIEQWMLRGSTIEPLLTIATIARP